MKKGVLSRNQTVVCVNQSVSPVKQVVLFVSQAACINFIFYMLARHLYVLIIMSYV